MIHLALSIASFFFLAWVAFELFCLTYWGGVYVARAAKRNPVPLAIIGFCAIALVIAHL
jgi:hypothetical protein